MRAWIKSSPWGDLLRQTPEHVERRLVRKAKKGDQEAFSFLYRQYLNAIYGFVFTRVGESMIAEDLTSQVFLKAWENIGQYQEQGQPFRAWLFRIARNLIIDYYRSTKTVTEVDILPYDAPDPSSDLEAQFEFALKEHMLDVAMEALTDEQREAICLKFMDGLSNQQIARKMGKRRGAIRALQMRGLQTLARVFKKAEYKVKEP